MQTHASATSPPRQLGYAPRRQHGHGCGRNAVWCCGTSYQFATTALIWAPAKCPPVIRAAKQARAFSLRSLPDNPDGKAGACGRGPGVGAHAPCIEPFCEPTLVIRNLPRWQGWAQASPRLNGGEGRCGAATLRPSTTFSDDPSTPDAWRHELTLRHEQVQNVRGQRALLRGQRGHAIAATRQ